MADIFNALQIVDWFRVRNYKRMLTDFSIDPVTQMKVMKLLYFVQGVELAVYNKPAFDEDILAWKYGPVIKSVHKKYYHKRELPLVAKKLGTKVLYTDKKALRNYSNINKNEFLSKVVNVVDIKLGDLTSSELMNLTHHEYPWKHAEMTHCQIISKDSIKKYFEKNIIVP